MVWDTITGLSCCRILLNFDGGVLLELELVVNVLRGNGSLGMPLLGVVYSNGRTIPADGLPLTNL